MRRRNRFKRARPTSARSTSHISSHRVVGMVSIKTIKNKNGRIIIKQGERIREDTLHEEGVLKEILANAMPGRSPGK